MTLDDIDPESRARLDEVSALTAEMRTHENAIKTISEARRSLILTLREHAVTYRLIAEAMGTTEQSVYKVIRGDL